MKAIIRNTKRKLYCGPTSICAVTGVDAATVLEIIEESRGERALKSNGQRKGVVGMTKEEVCKVLRGMGHRCAYYSEDNWGTILAKKWERYKHLPTLAQWLKETKPRGPMIVHLRGHWVAVDATTFIDTKTKGLPVRHGSCPYRRSRVKGYISLDGLPRSVKLGCYLKP